MHWKSSNCRGCGSALSRIQSIRGLCDNPECRRKDVNFQQQHRREATIQIIRNHIPDSWPANASLVFLPRNTHRLTPISGARVEALRRHLEQIVTVARTLPDQDADAVTETSATTNGVDAQQSTLPALGAACGLCGGHCCATGGNSAWLEPGTIRRLQWQDLFLSDARIVDHYLGFVPAISYENSCIYHAVDGCCLPRVIRSNVCNQYLCDGLAELANGLSTEPGICVAATLAGNTPMEVANMDAIGVLEKFTLE